jgi:hypothetical protein
LEGRAGDRLLDSYEAERRPVALDVGSIAAGMNDPRGVIAVGRSPLQTFWGLRRVFGYLGVGYGYGSSAVMLEPGRAPGPGTKDLKGRPGTRAPHVWLRTADGSTQRSSLDWLGSECVLWLGEEAAAWAEAARLVAADGAGPFRALRLNRDVDDERGQVAKAYGIGRAGASLIRPDGFVAWRARRVPATAADGARELRRVLDRVFAREAFARAS